MKKLCVLLLCVFVLLKTAVAQKLLSTTSSLESTSQKQSTFKSSIPAPSGSVITIPVKDGINIEMVKVEAGSFEMGATPEMTEPDDIEKPVHRVTLTNNYYIGKYEVTQALWQTVMGSNPSEFSGDDLPVENVSWNDCQDFVSKIYRNFAEKKKCIKT